jgi:hypothetical protein
MTLPRAVLVTAFMLSQAPDASGQGADDCFPSKSSNEARTMATFEVPLAFSGARAPVRQPAGTWHVGLEVATVPNVDPETATPTFCRPGKGPENTDLLFTLPRPRVSLVLPAGFVVEASWAPPIRVAEVKAHLVGVGITRVTPLGTGTAVLGLRAHGSFGVIKAPITCPDEALEDAASECYQGTRSDDSFKPNALGIEATIGWRLGRMFRPYLGTGYNRLAPRFQVNFVDQFGEPDRRRVEVDLNRVALFAGVGWQATTALELTGEMYAVPADAISVRLVGRVRLGQRAPGA